MKVPPEVTAPSLAEAIAVVNAEGAYQFKNSWLIDIDGRIKHFTHQDHEFVAKRTTIAKADKEIARARQAHHLLQEARIGSRARTRPA